MNRDTQGGVEWSATLRFLLVLYTNSINLKVKICCRVRLGFTRQFLKFKSQYNHGTGVKKVQKESRIIWIAHFYFDRNKSTSLVVQFLHVYVHPQLKETCFFNLIFLQKPKNWLQNCDLLKSNVTIKAYNKSKLGK